MSFSVDSRGLVSLNGKVLLLPESLIPKFKAIVDHLRPLIMLHSQRTGVPASWIAAIVWSETGFLGPKGGARAVSPAGAIGRMQLMPFWFTKPSSIGDGKAHTTEEMFNDMLNMRFGTDLLSLIRKEGNNLPQAASIYNCGGQPGSKPWRPKPAPTQNPRWGICGEQSGDGLSYIDHVAAANNTYLLDIAPEASPKDSSGNVALAVLGAAGAWFVARKFFR